MARGIGGYSQRAAADSTVEKEIEKAKERPRITAVAPLDTDTHINEHTGAGNFHNASREYIIDVINVTLSLTTCTIK